jgi:uncharacterized linocin/CFP29 family protein
MIPLLQNLTYYNESNYMNGYLGRDKVWNQQIWGDIDKAVQEEVGRIRVAQKVFPSTVVNNVLPVSRNRVVPFGGGVPVFPSPDEFQPFLEISTEFVLTQAQVDGEDNVHLAPSFAKWAASLIADAEDALLFLGPGSIPGLPPQVNVTNQPLPLGGVPLGVVAEANAYAVTAVDPGDLLGAIALGRAALFARAQPGPYALFLSPTRYAQSFAQPAAGLLLTPGDQIPHVVTGGFYMVNSLDAAAVMFAFPVPPPNADIGILVSLGGEPAKIILGTDAITAFTYTDPLGFYHFRVFERIQMVVRDGRAFQILQF